MSLALRPAGRIARPGDLVVLLLVGVASCADDGGPRLESVTPAAAARNATITVAGARLCGPADDCAHAGGEVLFGLSPPQIRTALVALEPTSLQVVVPAAASPGATHLLVTVDDRTSNALPFEVLP